MELKASLSAEDQLYFKEMFDAADRKKISEGCFHHFKDLLNSARRMEIGIVAVYPSFKEKDPAFQEVLRKMLKMTDEQIMAWYAEIFPSPSRTV